MALGGGNILLRAVQASVRRIVEDGSRALAFLVGRLIAVRVAFLGRISPEKRPDRAIRIARATGIPLKIAAKVDKVDEAYFRSEILPLIGGPAVEFIGEINEREKTKFLGDAAALLFPVDWPEPFAS
jgi:glycosyltransferase involved in cell wall biosynthesis